VGFASGRVRLSKQARLESESTVCSAAAPRDIFGDALKYLPGREQRSSGSGFIQRGRGGNGGDAGTT